VFDVIETTLKWRNVVFAKKDSKDDAEDMKEVVEQQFVQTSIEDLLNSDTMSDLWRDFRFNSIC